MNYANPLSIFWLYNFFGALCISVHFITLTFHWYFKLRPDSHRASHLVEVTRHFLLLGCCPCKQVGKREGFSDGEDCEFQLSTHTSRKIYGKIPLF